MAILHGLEPAALELVPDWEGRPRWRCPVCRTNGDGSHVVNGAVCTMLLDERAAKNRE